jgi:hypothetical protein
MKRRGGCSSSAMVSSAWASLGRIARLLVVLRLPPLALGGVALGGDLAFASNCSCS